MTQTTPISAPPPSRASVSISVAQRVSRGFPGPACLAGFALYAKNLVGLVAAGDGDVEATVKGDRTRKVRVRVERDALAIGCSCAPSSLDAPSCKHVWATLLEIDRSGALSRARDSRSALTVTPLVVDGPGDEPGGREPAPARPPKQASPPKAAAGTAPGTKREETATASGGARAAARANAAKTAKTARAPAKATAKTAAKTAAKTTARTASAPKRSVSAAPRPPRRR
jgi:hypothetical protein